MVSRVSASSGFLSFPGPLVLRRTKGVYFTDLFIVPSKLLEKTVPT